MKDGFTNVLASDLKVGGVSGAPWQTARLKTKVILGNQRLASRELPVSFCIQPGERYKIIIGMDILKEWGMTLDLNQEVLRFKLKDDKVNLKLTPRKMIYRSKQIKEYWDYIKKGRTITKANKVSNNALEEDDEDLPDYSCLDIDEVTASYVGDELAHVAALSQLAPALNDTPLDHSSPQEEPRQPSFAMSCQLASLLTGKDQPGGKMLNFKVDGMEVNSIVENHAVADVNVLFHTTEEECKSTHPHKVAIDANKIDGKLHEIVKEMQSLSLNLPTSEKQIQIRNAAIHALLTEEEESPIATCD